MEAGLAVAKATSAAHQINKVFISPDDHALGINALPLSLFEGIVIFLKSFEPQPGFHEKIDSFDWIEAAIAELEEALKGDDKEAMEEKTKNLTEVAGKLAERAYAQSAEAGAAEQAGAGGDEQAGAADDDNVVDAEFEEVDDDKK